MWIVGIDYVCNKKQKIVVCITTKYKPEKKNDVTNRLHLWVV